MTSDEILAQDNATVCSQGGRLFKATLFGCRSNGVVDNTSNIQKAIDYIAEQGGGTLVFEVGRYRMGCVMLRTGVNIQLNEGAILVGSDNLYDYQGRGVLLWGKLDEDVHLCGLGRIELPAGIVVTATPQIQLHLPNQTL